MGESANGQGRLRDERGHEYVTIAGERVYTDPLRNVREKVLSPGALAVDKLRAMGIPIPVEQPGRATVSAEELLDYEVPTVETLPVLGRDGLVMSGGTNLLYSFPKVGKTELLTALEAEWAQAGLTVLTLTEESFGNWKKRLAVHDCWSPRLRLHYAWGYHIADALSVVREERFDVLVVDTLRNTVGYQEGKGDEDVARVIHPLFNATAGRTVVCSYHARKMPGDGGRDISGHHALFGAFDRALQLTPIDGQETHRRILVSGRCMYDGDATLHYRQVEPGRFEPLDGAAVVTPKERPTYEVTCLDCGDEFTARRKDARFCSQACQKRHRRGATVSDYGVYEIDSSPRENYLSRTDEQPFLDGEW